MEEQISSLKSKLAEEKAKNEEVISTDRPNKPNSITNEELDKLLQSKDDQIKNLQTSLDEEDLKMEALKKIA